MEQDTLNLIQALRQRNPIACQQLLDEYGTVVYRMVRRIVMQDEDAEEVYQDVFMKVLRNIDRFDPRQSSLATWLRRIAYNESLNFVRSKRHDIVYMDDYEMEIDEMDDVSNETPIDEQTIWQLEKALTMLPPNKRALITMFYYDNMSLADIAYVTGSIPSTVGSQLSRIRKKLYRIIKSL